MVKKSIRRVITGSLCVAFGYSVAVAAPISVQLDGMPVSFAEKAAPIIRNGSTYVPFRAVFEAMGAQVSWDEETKTVAASRDGTSVSFPVGKNVVTIEENGETRTATASSASFMENGNTYIPVRIAAQALGAAVGWDNQTQSVLIVDAQKIAKEHKNALHLMDKYLNLCWPAQSRALSGKLEINYVAHTSGGDITIPATVFITGTADRQSISGMLTTNADISAMKTALETDQDAVEETLANLLTNYQKTTLAFVLSRADSTLYLKGAPLDKLGVPGGVWVRLPLDSALNALSGGQINEQSLSGAAFGDFTRIIAGYGGATALTSVADDNVAKVRTQIDNLAEQYADMRFSNEENIFTLSNHGMITGGESADELRLTVNEEGAVVIAERERVVSADGQIVSQLHMMQNEESLQMSAEIESKSYRATANLVLDFSSAEPPARRPDGKIIP